MRDNRRDRGHDGDVTKALFVGLTTIDIAYLVDNYPKEDSKTQASDQFLAAGGPAANAAVAYSFLAGTETTLVTALGSHPLTGIARNDLTNAEVRIVDVLDGGEQPPPISSIVVARHGRTRTLVSLDGSRIAAPAVDLSTELKDASFLLVDGHYPQLCLEAAQQARELGVMVVVDAGRWKDVYHELLPLADIAICSSAFQPPDVSYKPRAILQYLEDRDVSAAITDGGEPIIYNSTEGSGVLPVAAEPVIDTLGAGDILHGAFCHFFGRLPFPEALAAAAEVATFSCRYFGTREWMRHWPS